MPLRVRLSEWLAVMAPCQSNESVNVLRYFLRRGVNTEQLNYLLVMMPLATSNSRLHFQQNSDVAWPCVRAAAARLCVLDTGQRYLSSQARAERYLSTTELQQWAIEWAQLQEKCNNYKRPRGGKKH